MKISENKKQYDYHLKHLCTIRNSGLMSIDWWCLIKVY